MKTILTGMLLLACSLPAAAAWIPYLQTSATSEFYDPGSVVRTGTKVKVWALTNHNSALTNLEGKELLSEKSLTMIDCAENRIGAEAVLTFSGRDAAGTEVGHMETPVRYTPIKAGTADEALKKLLCQ
jgi:hypothetical protein